MVAKEQQHQWQRKMCYVIGHSLSWAMGASEVRWPLL